MRRPAELPDEALAALDAGWDRWDELQAEGCELHFELTVGGRVRVELRDREDVVLRPLAAREALAVAVPGATHDTEFRSVAPVPSGWTWSRASTRPPRPTPRRWPTRTSQPSAAS